MNENVKRALERVERAQQNFSKQPRFGADPDRFFTSTLQWIRRAELTEKPRKLDSRERDRWLRGFWKREPHLAGVLNSVVSIDQNRRWTLTGGRNQVRRYTHILRAAEDGQGWRRYLGLQSLSYYTSDLGAVTETGRDGPDGPLRALYHVDPGMCYLSGKRPSPLLYENNKDPWRREDYFRVTSMADTDEALHGLGFCATSRMLELAKLMVAIYEHDQERIGARAPKGLLLLQNISQEQWREAMTARAAALDGMEREWFGGVAVIASAGEAPEAKLVALSQLPADFNIKVFTDLLMYGYALALGYDPIEFWPVQAGSLGRGRETEIQHRKATGKGGANFMLSYQDQLQMQMPETLAFEFEERDQEGMLLDAEVAQAWADVARTLYEQGMGVLDREQARSLLAEQGIIPPEWTELEEEAMATDAAATRSAEAARLNQLRERMLETESVQRAIVAFPNDPIVRYQWPSGRTQVVWERAQQALTRQLWQVVKPPRLTQRQEEEPDEVLYEGEDFTITEGDVARAIDEGRRRVGDEFAELLNATALSEAEMDALDELGEGE